MQEKVKEPANIRAILQHQLLRRPLVVTNPCPHAGSEWPKKMHYNHNWHHTIRFTPESNPSEGFTDNSDPDFPCMDLCLYCLYGDDEQFIYIGVKKSSVASNSGSNKNGSVPSSATEPAVFVTSHTSTGFDRVTLSRDKLDRLFSESGGDFKVIIPVDQEGKNSSISATIVSLCPSPDTGNVPVRVVLPPEVQ